MAWWTVKVHRIRPHRERKRGRVTAAIYRDQTTKGELNNCWKGIVQNWRGCGPPRTVEDNAEVHTLSTNRSPGAQLKFNYLSHPPTSPDLNPIENVWQNLKLRLPSLPDCPNIREALILATQNIWNNIPRAAVDNGILNMPERLETVRNMRGNHIKY